jgi:hypothetical protein
MVPGSSPQFRHGMGCLRLEMVRADARGCGSSFLGSNSGELSLGWLVMPRLNWCCAQGSGVKMIVIVELWSEMTVKIGAVSGRSM